MSRLRTLTRSQLAAVEGRDVRAYLLARGLITAGRLSASIKAKTPKPAAASGFSVHSPIVKGSNHGMVQV